MLYETCCANLLPTCVDADNAAGAEVHCLARGSVWTPLSAQVSHTAEPCMYMLRISEWYGKGRRGRLVVYSTAQHGTYLACSNVMALLARLNSAPDASGCRNSDSQAHCQAGVIHSLHAF